MGGASGSFDPNFDQTFTNKLIGNAVTTTGRRVANTSSLQSSTNSVTGLKPIPMQGTLLNSLYDIAGADYGAGKGTPTINFPSLARKIGIGTMTKR